MKLSALPYLKPICQKVSYQLQLLFNALFHAFIKNGNLFKNGAVECDKICKHYGINRTRTIFF